MWIKIAQGRKDARKSSMLWREPRLELSGKNVEIFVSPSESWLRALGR
jgi:hypothetical protein